jgi:hypothetical protein
MQIRRKSILQSPEIDTSTVSQMKQANTKVTRHWYFHSNTQFAGPSQLDSLCFWDRKQRFLRTKPPSPPPKYIISPTWKLESPEILSPSTKNIDELHVFFSKHASLTQDYKYEGIPDELKSLLINSKNIFLLIRNPEGEICGTAASIFEPAVIGFKKEGYTAEFRYIDYICVHPQLRKRGIVGWLLGWLDHMTHIKFGPVAHFYWKFHLQKAWPPSPIPSITTLRLWKKKFDKRMSLKQKNICQVSHTAALKVLEDIVRNPNEEIQYDLGADFDLFCIPSLNQINWYRYTIEDTGCAILVGLCKTKYNITQVLYCSFIRVRPGNSEDMFGPFWDTSSEYSDLPRTVIESAARLQGCEWLVVSNLLTQYGGGREPSQWPSWTPEKAGLDLYLYNWMPPTFSLGSIVWLRPFF